MNSKNVKLEITPSPPVGWEKVGMRGAMNDINLLFPSPYTLSHRGRGDFEIHIKGVIAALLAMTMLAGCATPEVAVNSHADFSRIHRVAVASFSGLSGD